MFPVPLQYESGMCMYGPPLIITDATTCVKCNIDKI